MKKHFLILLAAVLLVAVSVPNAFAYFYTYTRGSRELVVSLKDSTDLDETVIVTQKNLSIKADAGSDPVYVRVKVFASEDLEVGSVTSGWEKKADGYYYYQNPIDGDPETSYEDTASIQISVSLKETEGTEYADSYNVVVIYETTPLLTDPDGAAYADWNNATVGGQG